MEKFSKFEKKIRNFRFPCYLLAYSDVILADRAFICGSTDAIGMQTTAGVQKIQRNMLHHPLEQELSSS